MKGELGGKIMTKLWLRAKTYSYLIDNGGEDEKSKCTKKCVIKRNLKFENSKDYLETTLLENKINYLQENKINLDSLTKIMDNS